MKEIVIIGGGIVGLAVGFKITRRAPGARVTVLEKESEVARHQSGLSSNVLHAGLYYKPGSAKARLAVSGIKAMTAFCRENGIPHEICGKLVVAASADELPRLQELFERGRKNGLRDLRLLDRSEMKEIEPHVGGIAALQVPEEGIVDFKKVCLALVTKIREGGGQVVTGAKVKRLVRRPQGWAVETSLGGRTADLIINCAGLQCDRIAEMAGEKCDARIVPFRGEYYTIRSDRRFLVKNLIYPVPDPVYPFLGVHFTRMIGGGVEAGPNAVLAFGREAYRKTQFDLRDMGGIFMFPGFWRFAGKHLKMCAGEIARSFSKRLFCRSLKMLVPEISQDDLVPGQAGVRAQAMTADGTLVQDFLILKRPGALHVLNAPSPAATASLAIADEIVSLIGDL
jgi:L-2-hydroxyglutarate oxidase